MKTDKPHTLKPSKTQPLPTRILFFDTETDVKPLDSTRKVHNLKLGIMWDCERVGVSELEVHTETVFESEEELYPELDRVLVGNQTVYMVAHNIAYDAMIVHAFTQLPALGFKLESMYSKAQVTIIRWSREKTKLIMLDNGNFFGGTLERWGDIFNVPKIKIDFDACSHAELVAYCRRDVEIMFIAWSTWFDFLIEHDCGGFRVTVGSTAFNTWRHRFLSDDVYVHKEREVLKLERAAYHGGRVECFYQGTLTDGPYYYADINNMYGYVMRNGRYPIGLQGYSNSLPISRLINYLTRYNVIAYVRVNVDEPAFTTKVNGFTAYPLGRFDVALTTDELILALRNGWLEYVHALAWYRTGEIYRDYIDHFYPLRMHYKDQGNNGFAQITKLFMNALYGKFGQMGLRQEIIGECEPDEIWSMSVHNISTGVDSRMIALGGIVMEEFREGESYHAMPAVAAHVTANARLYLLSLIRRAGWENVYYCDTDSMILNREGHDRLSDYFDDQILGMLKVEISSPTLTIWAAKEYQMGDRLRLKGIRKSAIEVGPGVYLQERWPKLAGSIRNGMPKHYITELAEKHQSRRVRSGLVTAEGWVEPFLLA